MDLFYVLLILLVVTRAFGELAERIAQPALVGELIAGIALGAVVAGFPGVFPSLSGLGNNEVFVTITDLGMFFLMLLAWLTGVLGTAEPPGLVEFAMLTGKAILFFAATAVIGLFVFPWGGRFVHKLKMHELEMSAMLIAAFAFAVLAEIALKAGLFSQGGGVVEHVFSAVILMSVVTTVVSPMILSHVFGRGAKRVSR